MPIYQAYNTSNSGWQSKTIGSKTVYVETTNIVNKMQAATLYLIIKERATGQTTVGIERAVYAYISYSGSTLQNPPNSKCYLNINVSFNCTGASTGGTKTLTKSVNPATLSKSAGSPTFLGNLGSSNLSNTKLFTETTTVSSAYTASVTYCSNFVTKGTGKATYSTNFDWTIYGPYIQITFDKNGHNGTVPSPIKAMYNTATSLSSYKPNCTDYTPVDEDGNRYKCTFAWWDYYAYKSEKSADVPTNKRLTSSLPAQKANITIYERSGFPSRSVSFNGNTNTGGSQASRSNTCGYNVSIPTTTGYTKTGHSFTGWYDDAGFTNTLDAAGELVHTDTGNVVTAVNKIGHNHTVYAHWTPNKYIITFDKQTGTGGTDSIAIIFGLTPLQKIIVPSLEGQMFYGYYDKPNGQGVQRIDNEGNWVNTTNESFTSNTTLYANYGKILDKYTITYNLGIATNGVVPGNQIKIETFDAILADNSGNLAKQPSTTDVYYNVVFDLAGGDYSTTKFTASKTTTTSYAFTKWNTSVDGSGTDYNTLSYYTTDADLQLYPKFNATSTTATTKILLGTPTRKSYKFLGWSDGTTTYAAGTEFIPTADVTLTALWELITYDIKYLSNGGSPTDAIEKKIQGESYYIADGSLFAKMGFKLAGWQTTATGGNQYQFGQEYTTDAPLTLYAVWEALPPEAVYIVHDGVNGGTFIVYDHDSNSTPRVVRC